MEKSYLRFTITRSLQICIIAIILLFSSSIACRGQEEIRTEAKDVLKELVNMGFENIRCTETESELIYTIENNVYKAKGVGIAKAIEVIQSQGLPINKPCKVIVTHLEIPELALTYRPSIGNDSIPNSNNTGWETSYDLGDSWKKIKDEKVQNSSRFKVDIVIYPQLSYKNLIITQIYQVLFTLNPAIEFSLWEGMKFTGQVVIPIYNDGYGRRQDKVHPGFITISQSFRLPYNIKGKATLGCFNADRYGVDLRLFRPFSFDERFSLEAKVGMTGIGYWDGFKLHYDKDMTLTWTIGANFYWPKYNTQFSLKGEQYLMKEKGIKVEMIRHFRYASVGFYAMKAEHANSNGGFKFQILLPPYKYKRFKGNYKYIPRINTSNQMGTIYNAGNEQLYYKQYKSEASDNIMNNNSFNPYFIKSELSNFNY